jgi:hypothetical protein
MRLINIFEQGNFKAKVYKDYDWNEFVVKYEENSKLLPESEWSHEYTKQDAESTAKAELRFLNSKK